MKGHTKKFMAKRRAWLDEQKSAPCMDCKNSFPPVCMDFDHVRGEKEHDVARMYRRAGLERLKAEIAKCDLVCSNCHRIRTAARGLGF